MKEGVRLTHKQREREWCERVRKTLGSSAAAAVQKISACVRVLVSTSACLESFSYGPDVV